MNNQQKIAQRGKRQQSKQARRARRRWWNRIAIVTSLIYVAALIGLAMLVADKPEKLAPVQQSLRESLGGDSNIVPKPISFRRISPERPKEWKGPVKNVRIVTGDAFLDRYTVNDVVPRWITEHNLNENSSQIMMSQFFEPTKLEIIESYSIEELRETFVKIWEESKAGKLQMGILWSTDMDQVRRGEAKYPPLGTTTTALNDPKIPYIQIYAQTFRDRMLDAASEFKPAKARESVLDLYVAVMLHEYYHATRQTGWQKSTVTIKQINSMGVAVAESTLTPEEGWAAEADCWAYTCRDVLAVMRKHGRGTLPPNSVGNELLRVYSEIGGDTSRPEWMEAIKRYYPHKK